MTPTGLNDAGVAGSETVEQVNKPFTRVFLSYSHEDGAEFGKELADWLEYNGFDTWMDHAIVGGEEYDAAIERGIRDCDVFVVVVTADVDRRHSFVRREIQFADDHGKPIVPIRIDKSKGPILLRRRQWLSETEALGQEMVECLEKLTAADTNEKRKRTVLAFRRLRVTRSQLFIVALPILAAAVLVLSSLPPDRFSLSVEEAKKEYEIRGQGVEKILTELGEDESLSTFSPLHKQHLDAIDDGSFTRAHTIKDQIDDVLGPIKTENSSRHIVYKHPIPDMTVSEIEHSRRMGLQQFYDYRGRSVAEYLLLRGENEVREQFLSKYEEHLKALGEQDSRASELLVEIHRILRPVTYRPPINAKRPSQIILSRTLDEGMPLSEAYPSEPELDHIYDKLPVHEDDMRPVAPNRDNQDFDDVSIPVLEFSKD